MQNLEIIILLLTIVTFLAALSEKINFPLPILLVIIGLVISLIPGLPLIELSPEIVFLIFLPPLLYGAAWGTSWHDFKANLRPITLAAVGMVLFTTCAVAWAAHTIVPGLGWPEAFILGAIVSPPDAVAATSVTKGLGLHRKLIAILEGESLVNDASGLIALRYAIVALATGNFVLWKAGLEFLWVSAAGIGIGLAIGYVIYLIHKYLLENPVIETVLTFLTPFVSYLLAEHVHVSGVLAVVSTGLYITYRQSEIFSHITRIQAVAVWNTIIFILNGIIFILIGLQLRHVLDMITKYEPWEIIGYGAIISGLVIVVRLIWVFPAAYVPRWMSKRLREKEYTSVKNVFIMGWAGMRGVVSMAAALALPLTIGQGTPFPNRDLIIFLTFCVIISTLVLQGLSLPYIIKWIKYPAYSVLEEEYQLRLKVAGASIVHIEENLSFGQLSDEVLAQIKSKYEIKINRLRQTDLHGSNKSEVSRAEEIFNQHNQIQSELIGIERELIKQMYKEGKASDEVLRKLEYELDLEESRLALEKHST